MAGGSSLHPCGVLLGAALAQPLVLGLQQLGAGHQQEMPGEPAVEERSRLEGC